jgi:hypothetical protein
VKPANLGPVAASEKNQSAGIPLPENVKQTVFGVAHVSSVMKLGNVNPGAK